MTHICVGNLTTIGSDNGLSPGRHQAITWTNVGILLIGPLRTNLSEILIGIQTVSFKKMHLKMSSAKWRPFVSASMCWVQYVLWELGQYHVYWCLGPVRPHVIRKYGSDYTQDTQVFQLTTTYQWLGLWERKKPNSMFPLRWRHNNHAGVSNHQPHGCLLNRLFRRKSKKTSKLRVTGLCAGISPGPVNSPHKGPVTRKMFPFDDVIMPLHNTMQHFNGWTYIIVTNSPYICVCDLRCIYTQRARTLGSTSIRHRSDSFASDRRLIDSVPRVNIGIDTQWLST